MLLKESLPRMQSLRSIDLWGNWQGSHA